MAESAASLALMLPLSFAIIYASMEVNRAYIIQNTLTEASRGAARLLTFAYADNENIAYSRDLQDTLVFDKIRVANVIADSAQFDDPTFDFSTDPPNVSVTVRYTGGQYGLSTFPTSDFLTMGGQISLTITGSSTFRL